VKIEKRQNIVENLYKQDNYNIHPEKAKEKIFRDDYFFLYDVLPFFALVSQLNLRAIIRYISFSSLSADLVSAGFAQHFAQPDFATTTEN
jgi:hypothetical protein